MFIPLRTNRTPRRRPLVTEGLIVVNMLVFLAGLMTAFGRPSGTAESFASAGHLARDGFRAWQLVTYQFLHDPSSIWHLAFNMLFLWVFGSSVEDRIGRASFLGFYLIGGAVAGTAHMMIQSAPVIGASGSIAAVTGAFLALFPRSRVQVFVFLIIWIGVYSIPALWFIGFFFAVDVLRQAGQILGGGGERVAYLAHIAGYLYGFSLAVTLLATGIVGREEFDVFYLFKQARRRAAFRATTRGTPGGAWESASADTDRRLARRAAQQAPPTTEEIALAEALTNIDRLIMARDLPAAAARYADLLRRSPGTALTEDRQLDIANQLHADGDFANAAAAYELLLARYSTCAKAPEVRLILALVYARRLGRPERAIPLLEAARERLTDPDQKALADQLTAEIEA